METTDRERQAARERLIARGVRDPWTWGNELAAVQAIDREVREFKVRADEDHSADCDCAACHEADVREADAQVDGGL